MQEFFKRFDQMGPYEANPKIGVAISGGIDSLALTLLLNHWLQLKKGILYALTIDHQLRPESKNECEAISIWLKSYGIKHFTLKATISDSKNLSAQARKERYLLLTEWCKKNDVLDLFLAHTLDDQAENFVIRAMRGSSTEGLSHIKYISYQNNTRILRPFLDIEKSTLETFLKLQNQSWIEDPSNQNSIYLRARVRHFLNSNYLENSTLIKKRFKNVSAHITQTNNIIKNLVYDFTIHNITISPAAYIKVKYKAFLKLEKAIGLKILAKILISIGKLAYPPRLKSLDNLYELIINVEKKGSNTFSNTKLIKEFKNDCFYIISENFKSRQVIKTNEFNWLNFKIKLENDILKEYSETLEIDYLDDKDFTKNKNSSIYFLLQNIPKFILYNLPVIRCKENIFSIPHLKYYTSKFTKNDIILLFHPIIKI